MGYDLRLSLRNPDGSDAGFLRGATAFSVQPQLNAAGGATLSYPRNGPQYQQLSETLRAAGRVVLWLYSGDQRLRRDAAAVILEYSNGQDRSSALAGEIVTFTGRLQEALLDDAPSADIAADEPQYLPDTYGTAGAWVVAALNRAKSELDAFPGIDVTCTPTHDSDGVPWPGPVSLSHGSNDSLLGMCSSLANDRSADFRLRAKDDDSGWWLDAFLFGTMGSDQSSSLLLYGNAATVSREAGNVRRYNVLIATHTDVTARVVVEDAAAIAAAGGQRIIKTEACPLNIADEAALQDWATARLAQVKAAEYQVVHSGMRHEDGDQPRFGLDYGLGDYVSSLSDEARGFERLRVEAGRLALIRNATVETSATLGYSFGDISVRLYHGGDATPGSGANGNGYTVPAYTVPAFDSPYFDSSGQLTPDGAAQFGQDYGAAGGAVGATVLQVSNNAMLTQVTIAPTAAVGPDGYFLVTQPEPGGYSLVEITSVRAAGEPPASDDDITSDPEFSFDGTSWVQSYPIATLVNASNQAIGRTIRFVGQHLRLKLDAQRTNTILLVFSS